jgi:hypothetical protein
MVAKSTWDTNKRHVSLEWNMQNTNGMLLASRMPGALPPLEGADRLKPDTAFVSKRANMISNHVRLRSCRSLGKNEREKELRTAPSDLHPSP